MSLAYTPDRLRLPESLQAQLHEFRRLVWTIKIVEAVAAAAFGILVAYLVLFGLDRVWDTPGWLRAALFVAAAVGLRQHPGGPAPLGLAAPAARAARPAALPQASAGRRPVAGDHRAGAQRIRAGPVARAVRGGDPRGRPGRPDGAISSDAVPHPRHRLWACAGGVFRWPSRSACSALFPAAAANAWQRFLAPGEARRATPSRRSRRLPDRSGRRARRAVLDRHAAHRRDRLAAQAGRRSARRQQPGDRPA